MKKIFYNICSIVILLLFLISILINYNCVNASIAISFQIWKENLFPFLFPIFVISEILVSFGFIELLSTLIGNFIHKLFDIKKEASFILVMSLISGFPSSAKYINNMYERGFLDDNEASRILMFTHFSNPLFIIGGIATTFLGNGKLALLIIICHYLPNLIIGIFFRNYNSIKKENKKIFLTNKSNLDIKENNINLGNILGNAILNSINTLLLILGTISIFLVITSILNNLINFGPTINALLNGIIEMSQGLKYISLLNISTRLKVTFSTMIISFGGFCVHLQIMSILNKVKIKYSLFLLTRIIHMITSGILAYFLFPILS